jgi:hypothetical protein
METEQVSLTDALSEESIREVGEKIAGLPTAEEFRQTVEDDLWSEFTGIDEPPEDSIAWDELPDESKSIFGYVDEEEEETVPWWFESFRWEVESRGEKIDEVGDRLSALRNFDASTTTVRIHGLADESIVTVLKQFHELGEAIDDNIGVQTERDNTLPSEVFEITDGTLKTTSDFKNWFEDLLGLCPPFNEVLTSLVMVNSNVKIEAIEDLVPDELLITLQNIGVIHESRERVYESRYHEPIAGGLSTRDAILKNMGGVFDRTLPPDVDSLELLFYRSWAENYDGDKERLSKWIQKASKSKPSSLRPGEEQNFGAVSFGIPLRLTTYSRSGGSRMIYTTGGMNRNGEYPSGSNIRGINKIMRSAGFLQE